MRRRFYVISAAAIFFFACSYSLAVTNEQQVKFEFSDKSVIENIKYLRNILSYKVKPIGEYFYQDYYYDTPDLALFKSGYSYRFRIRDKGDGKIEYGVQLKEEYGAGDAGYFKRVEIDDVLPGIIGEEISSGKWQKAFIGLDGYKTVKALTELLDKNKIDKSQLSPFMYAKQKRTRLKLKEEGSLYFEVSLDDSTFNLINDSARSEHFYQLEFENKFRKGTPSEDEKRIQDLIKFFTQNYPVALVRDSKYRKVITDLSGTRL